MSSFQFSDEEEPKPSTPAPSQPAPAVPTPAPVEEDDDFSFLAQPPAAPAPQPQTPQAKPKAPPSPAPQARTAQPKTPQPLRPKAPVAPQVPVAPPQTPAPSANAPTPARPLRPAAPKVNTGANTIPDPIAPELQPGQRKPKATFDPDAVHPVGVPSPQAAPNPAAAAALTPTPTTPAAEEIETGLETGEKISGGFYGMGEGIRHALNLLEGPATWALRVGGTLGLLCLAFVLAAVFFGGASNLAANPKATELVKNLGLAANGFSICLLMVAIAVLLLAYEDNKFGAIIAGVGVLLLFGTPLALKVLGLENKAGDVILVPFAKVGRVLFYLGAAKAIIDLFDFLWKLPERVKMRQAEVGKGRPTEAKQRAIASQANMFSPCWKLPFCREAIRVLCPAFIAKKTCWKFGRGCYCDEEMIGRIVRGEPMEAIKAPTRISQGKAPCGRCYIYLEHQTYKFRMLSPLALPATIAIAFFGYPLYEKVFHTFDDGLKSVWGTFSFNPNALGGKDGALTASAEGLKAAQDASMSAAQVSGIAQALIGVMLGFFLLVYISKAIEWAIFKAKL